MPHVKGNYQTVVTVKNGNWILALKDRKNKWIYTDSKIKAEVGKIYSMVLETKFTEYGTEAALFLNGKVVAKGKIDAEIGLVMFVFYPGTTHSSASLDNLKIGDSLKAVTK